MGDLLKKRLKLLFVLRYRGQIRNLVLQHNLPVSLGFEERGVWNI